MLSLRVTLIKGVHVKKCVDWATEMAQSLKVPLIKPGNLNSILRIVWWK